MGIPYLRHIDLILEPGERRRSAGFYGYLPPEVLIPLEIPLHPTVAKSDLSNSKQFSDEILPNLPGMVRQDLEAITNKIGVHLRLRITDEGMFEDDEPQIGFKFADVQQYQGWAIKVGSTSMYFHDDKKTHRARLQGLPEELLEAYVDQDGQYFIWHVNNFSWYGIGFELFARNYAIAFNNQGIDKLKKR